MRQALLCFCLFWSADLIVNVGQWLGLRDALRCNIIASCCHLKTSMQLLLLTSLCLNVRLALILTLTPPLCVSLSLFPFSLCLCVSFSPPSLSVLKTGFSEFRVPCFLIW